MPRVNIENVTVPSEPYPVGVNTRLFQNRCRVENPGRAPIYEANAEYALLDSDANPTTVICRRSTGVKPFAKFALVNSEDNPIFDSCRLYGLKSESGLGAVDYKFSRDQLEGDEEPTVQVGFKAWLDTQGEPDYPPINGSQTASAYSWSKPLTVRGGEPGSTLPEELRMLTLVSASAAAYTTFDEL